jgi:SnoaL-like domain
MGLRRDVSELTVYNTHDADAFGKKLAPDIVLYSPLFADGIRGHDGHRQINERFFKSMPDFEFKVINVAAKRDFVAAVLVGVGTSKGPAELPGRDPIVPVSPVSTVPGEHGARRARRARCAAGLRRRALTGTRSNAIQGDGKSGPQPAHSRLSMVDRVCGAPVARITRIR